jgi:6-phosphogluconolactonase (cycloisomerase 2 family)
MASPVIDSVSPPGPLNLTPGQSVVFTIAAHDPDTKTGASTFTVTDAEGNATQVTVNLTVNDPLTYSATTNVGTITQSPTIPTQFTLQV